MKTLLRDIWTNPGRALEDICGSFEGILESALNLIFFRVPKLTKSTQMALNGCEGPRSAVGTAARSEGEWH